MFGRNKTYVVSYLRDLKDEWNHLGKAMQYWMYFTAIVIICFLGIVTRYIIIYHNDVMCVRLKFRTHMILPMK